ncbi:PP2C family protein-serine/threonine phosphatase [Psychrobacillus sp. PGGUH221]|uniref:PP2C family protein-serine/threonine phosphatase n=1 Tax=Psychrobacillus sp. PGGUH221 TaxID=3020058 RepID=UPI0035C6E90F
MFQKEFTLVNTAEEEKVLKREINLARNIQMKLLNGETPSFEDGEVSGISIPARLIGGDYYDFSYLPNGKIRIVIGDVMGKGIPAAMLMILTRGVFRSVAEITNGPGDTLAEMNKVMFKDLRSLGSFVTVFCADWDPIAKILTFANAGHNLPIVVRSSDKVQSLPKTKGVMIGGLPNQEYPEESIQLENNSFILFYTDGVIEATNGKGEMYRVNRLENLLLSSFGKEIKAIETAIVDSIQNFTEDTPQRDDITLVLLKVSKEKTDITSFNSPILIK